MKRDVVLAGVGGQGLLSISATIGEAARAAGLCVRQSEVHGMAQRGGVVQSYVRYSDGPVYSDTVRHGRGDLILALEPMEGLRYLPLLSLDAALVTSAVPLRNIPDYPSLAVVLDAVRRVPHGVLIDADAVARAVDAPLSANIVMLGAATSWLGLPPASLEEALRRTFSSKSAPIVAANLRAFRAGLEAAIASPLAERKADG